LNASNTPIPENPPQSDIQKRIIQKSIHTQPLLVGTVLVLISVIDMIFDFSFILFKINDMEVLLPYFITIPASEINFYQAILHGGLGYILWFSVFGSGLCLITSGLPKIPYIIIKKLWKLVLFMQFFFISVIFIMLIFSSIHSAVQLGITGYIIIATTTIVLIMFRGYFRKPTQ
jgi:hypothetical protein